MPRAEAVHRPIARGARGLVMQQLLYAPSAHDPRPRYRDRRPLRQRAALAKQLIAQSPPTIRSEPVRRRGDKAHRSCVQRKVDGRNRPSHPQRQKPARKSFDLMKRSAPPREDRNRKRAAPKAVPVETAPTELKAVARKPPKESRSRARNAPQGRQALARAS